MAKTFIQEGDVLVNGEGVHHARQKLHPGDEVTFMANTWRHRRTGMKPAVAQAV